jgi:hypothetical protein
MKLETKSDYVKAHKKLWDAISKKIKRGDDICDIKEKEIRKLKVPNIAHNCFGCQWTMENFGYSVQNINLCESCLFLVKDNSGCLNGLWRNICSSGLSTRSRRAIARKIGDFPIRP